MPNVDEIMQDSESLSYDLTMKGETRRAPTPVILPDGHVIDNVSRKDGSSVWVCQSCGRATTPIFNAAARPFDVDTVRAWHDGTERAPDGLAHEQELITAGALVIATRAELKKIRDQIELLRTEEGKAESAVDASMRRRDIAIDDAQVHMPIARVAKLAQMTRPAVYDRIKKGRTSA